MGRRPRRRPGRRLPRGAGVTDRGTDPLSRDPVNNPLAELARHAGLGTRAAARLAGVPFAVAAEALSPTPANNVLRGYLRLMGVLGARPLVRPARPWSAWVDLAHVDGLYRDDGFRRAARLPPMPPTRVALRRRVVYLRSRRRLTYGSIVDYLQDGHVCTAEGLARWRRGTIGQYVDARWRTFPDDDRPVVPGPAALRAWREFFVAWVFRRCRLPDPMLRTRWGIEPREEGGRVVFGPEGRMPAVAAGWVIDALGREPWIDGRWGVTEPPPAGSEAL